MFTPVIPTLVRYNLIKTEDELHCLFPFVVFNPVIDVLMSEPDTCATHLFLMP